MVYNIGRLESDVMMRLGEIPRPQTLLPDTSIPSPSDILSQKIKGMLPEVGTRLIVEASPETLGGGEDVEADVSMRLMPCGLYAAEVKLPEGFLRLGSFRMSGWERGVSRLVLPGTGEWDCQWSAESGIAGSPERPRVYLDGPVLRGIGCREGSDALVHFRCWRVPEPDAEGSFSFPPPLYPSLVKAIADGD